jgi:hypothetical protein
MTYTITLSEDFDEALQQESENQRVTPETLILDTLVHRLTPIANALADKTRDDTLAAFEAADPTSTKSDILIAVSRVSAKLT